MQNFGLANKRGQKIKLAIFSAFLLAIPVNVHAATVVNRWRPLFEGIDYATGFSDEPVPQNVNSLRVDLLNRNIQFLSTPSNGSLPEETTAQTTSQFLDEFDLQVAVNANFFAPCCDAISEPKDLIGLAISNGEIVSSSDGMISENIGEVPDSLLIAQDNQAEIASTNPGDDFTNIFTAVSAGPRLLLDGKVLVDEIPPDDFSDLNPRTAVGISQDEQFLILITIDGRQPGFSEGATLFQTAEWLRRFGAYQGLNLDGGGSTTMVREDREGNPQGLNRFSGGSERFNGNNFGVYANSLVTSVPEPGSLVGLGLFSLVFLNRKRSDRR